MHRSRCDVFVLFIINNQYTQIVHGPASAQESKLKHAAAVHLFRLTANHVYYFIQAPPLDYQSPNSTSAPRVINYDSAMQAHSTLAPHLPHCAIVY